MYKLAGARSYSAMSKLYSTSFMFVIGLSGIGSRIVLEKFLSALNQMQSFMHATICLCFCALCDNFSFCSSIFRSSSSVSHGTCNPVKWLLGCQVFNDQTIHRLKQFQENAINLA